VFVSDGQATHVDAVAVGEVQATDEQTVLRDVERGQPAAGVDDGAVALEERLRTPRLREPPRRRGQALGRTPHGQHAVVGGIEVGLLAPKLVVTEHAAIVAARCVGSKRVLRRRMNREVSDALPLRGITDLCTTIRAWSAVGDIPDCHSGVKAGDSLRCRREPSEKRGSTSTYRLKPCTTSCRM
jgi:hypothetical protein